MALQLNPTVNDPFPTQTLKSLRTMVLDACGFLPQQLAETSSSFRTLGDMTTQARNALGLATPTTPVLDTLGNIRTEVVNMLNFAAMSANLPPGVATMINSFINTAQQTMFRAIELDQGTTTPPPLLVTDGQSTILDSRPITYYALALAKAHYGRPDAQVYFQLYEKFLKDLLDRNPPNIQNMIVSAFQDAQRELARTYEVNYATGGTSGPNLAPFAAPTDTPTLDAYAIYKLGVANLKALLKQPDAQQWMAEYKTYLGDLYRRMPPEATTFINRTLKQAQDFLFRTYKVFRMERWFTWTLVQGQRFYGTLQDDNSAATSPTGLTATIGTSGSYGSLNTPRSFFGSVLLDNGKILLFGGYDTNSNLLSSAELYDPTTGLFSPTGSMAFPIVFPTYRKMSNGKVLIAGGLTGPVTNSAQIYDPATGIFSATGSMLQARLNFRLALLQNGKVMAIGGSNGASALSSCELYDPATGTWSATGSLATARTQMVTTTLQTGKVLAAGGGIGAELYDPTTGTWGTVSNLFSQPTDGIGVSLPNGTFLVFGGIDGASPTSASNYYNAVTNSFDSGTQAAMQTPRDQAMSVLLPNGKVLVMGGTSDGLGNVLSSTEIYNPATNSWSAGPAMPSPRKTGHAFLLASGKVVIFGGYTTGNVASTTAITYDPTGNTFTTNGGLTAGTPYYRVANFNAQGYTIPSLPDASVAGVPANTSVVLNWVNSTNPSITGTAIYGRSVAAATTTSAQFVIAQQGSANNVVTVASATGITTGSKPSISDGTNTLSVTVTNVVGNTLTYTINTIVSGAAGNIMATAASVLISSEQLLAIVGQGVTTWTDYGTIVPNGAMPTINGTSNVFGIDPREVTWVGASCNANTWRPLVKGVPPYVYNTTTMGPPQFYDIRQAIEIWPAPSDSTWQLQIKGVFSPLPFDADTDTCWIDWQPIFLWATYLTKQHYKQPDAATYQNQAIDYIKSLVAGTHQTARYIPFDGVYRPDPPRPLATSYFTS